MGPQNGDEAAGLMAVLLVVVCGLLIVVLVVGILFLLTLQRTLAKCSPRNRTMEPGLVWLNLIPCFNIVWQFVTVIRVADSLRNEFEDRGERRDESYGKTLGLTCLILNIGSSMVGRASDAAEKSGNEEVSLILAAVSMLVGIPALILFIVYWVRIAGYGRELSEMGRYDERDYDRPRRRRRDEYDDPDDDEDRDRDRRYRDEDDRDRYDR